MICKACGKKTEKVFCNKECLTEYLKKRKLNNLMGHGDVSVAEHEGRLRLIERAVKEDFKAKIWHFKVMEWKRGGCLVKFSCFSSSLATAIKR